MSFVDPSVVQRVASDPNHSVYLSASAGTGKTKVLVDRYLRILLKGSLPNKILCLTFTNSAAGEMLTRIQEKLLKWANADEASLAQELQELTGTSTNNISRARALYDVFLDDFNNLKIQTLHSFCVDVLKKSSGYSLFFSDYEIIQGKRRHKLLHQAFQAAVQGMSKDPDYTHYLSKLTELYDSNRLLELVAEVFDNKMNLRLYLNRFQDLKSFNEENRKRYGIDNNSSIGQVLEEIINVNLPLLYECLEQLQENEEKLSEQLKIGLEKLLRVDTQAVEISDIMGCIEYIGIFLKDDGTKKVKLVKDAFKSKHQKYYQFLVDEQERVQVLGESLKSHTNCDMTTALALLCKAVLEIYEDLKLNKRYLEYDDLILHTIQILENADDADFVLYKLDIGIDHILIDEAQDLSKEQWRVIQLISQEFFVGLNARDCQRTIFIVGDFKQSIFGFQGAAPYYFEAVKKYYASKASNAMQKFLELDMNVSFRSTDAILSFVDQCFNHPHNKEKIVVNQSHHIKHPAFRRSDGKVEIWPLEEICDASSKRDKTEQLKWRIPENIPTVACPKRALALQIVDTIKTWIDSGRLLSGHQRPVQPQDIMILLRKRSEIVDYLIAFCRKGKIPVTESYSIVLGEHLAILDLLSVVRFITLPKDDYNLACLLKSPIIGFSEEDLFRVAHSSNSLERTEGRILANLKLYRPEVYIYLTSLIQRSKNFTLYSFFYQILFFDQKYDQFVHAFGENIKEILYLFLDAAVEFEKSECYGNPYQHFDAWIQSYHNTALVSNDNKGIRILTVHAAKGLQAPIVFLADSASSEQLQSNTIFWDDNCNMYMSGYKEFDSRTIKQLKGAYIKSQAEESMRLLYVAMTRAEDELYVCGWNNNRIANSWYRTLSDTKL
ncbi:hypothetical protein EDM53_05585 [Rickettsiales endosymbiont of Peranema trichophorum]|uniref:UvrD-helicase domain-containing protein n=1 Tax=Rickettsiales endosymbiont of Peranema trichophorum TaxID=2486577 RepID=UPI00102383F4|nr:UvrD-helicase domain-containing protein [Rickettsiales endosymbiont of Peranema trichophorum]RZI45252.1 hypothetical protein EDM53_05585 [Rickettsiales endosymbiont of Peranema trichophorum]